jgi:N-acetylglucosamine-6-phosphate deacetylase
MSLTLDEIITLAPEAVELVKTISDALKTDDDGHVHLTKDEARAIRALVFKLAVHVAEQAID